MREKAAADLKFRERLLRYIDQAISESLPEEILSDENMDDDIDHRIGRRVFQPFISPDDPHFDEEIKLDLGDILRTRQMHSWTHMSTCFKYGSKRCRSRFPRRIILEMHFDTENRVFYIKRNHRWLNNHNKWIAVMTRANHDCQFLFTKNHALASIYYVMKYISKPETALHSKLTIAAAIRRVLQSHAPSAGHDIGRLMLLKIYNKIESYREVGVPEAISHLLQLPDHYTGATFSKIHTTHLLAYIKRGTNESPRPHDLETGADNVEPDTEIVVNNGHFTLVSPFDDYANRGDTLSDYCLYDYCTLVSKDRKLGGIPFESSHPQHVHHRQFVRKVNTTVPNLLGRLLFLRKDSEVETEREDYYCLISALFFPWSVHQPLTPQGLSWQAFFEENSQNLTPRLL
jgi:hypothetical protein